MFEARFGCAGGFAALGAAVRTMRGGRELWIEGAGARPLHGAQVAAGDLRGGAALVVAALAAEGESRIAGCGYIDRGYPALEQMLARLGARICREMPPEAPRLKKMHLEKEKYLQSEPKDDRINLYNSSLELSVRPQGGRDPCPVAAQ